MKFIVLRQYINFIHVHCIKNTPTSTSIHPTGIEYIMKYFVNTKPVKTGRWNTHMYKQYAINKKIDLANEDHCGVCNKTIHTNQK